MKEASVKLDCGNLFYRSTGSGPVVVLIHGFGQDSTVWKNQYDAFSGYTLILLNLPGSGKSSAIKDMSMENLAEITRQFLDALKVEKCIVIGHSMGGYMMMAFVEKYSSYLQAFGLFHSTAFADSEERKVMRRKGIGFIKENGAYAFIKTVTPNMFSAETREQRPALVQEQTEASNYFTDDTLIACYEAMIIRPDRREVLGRMKIPVCFIMGRHDQAVPFKDTLEQCHLPSESHVLILEHTAHMGMQEEPAKVNEHIRNFLDKVTGN